MITRLLVSSCTAVLLAASGVQAQSHHNTAERVAAPDATPITVTGCLVRPSDSSAHPTGSQTPGGGTLARTNEGKGPSGGPASGSANRGAAATQLVLIVTNQAPDRPVGTSAVPGSIPSGTDSGTVPTQTIVGTTGRATSGATTAFLLSADAQVDIGSHIGQRVEISGMRSEVPSASAEAQVVRRGERTSGTRSEGVGIVPAHPSAELPRIDVATVKPLGGTCDK
jgi:hypothetical protein